MQIKFVSADQKYYVFPQESIYLWSSSREPLKLESDTSETFFVVSVYNWNDKIEISFATFKEIEKNI